MNWPGVNPSDEHKAEYLAWLEERPEHVHAIAKRFDPWTMYRLTTTGQRCSFLGCDEGAQNCGDDKPDQKAVTLRIIAQHPSELIALLTQVEVFGVDPDSLVPWTDEDERPWSMSVFEMRETS